MRPFTRGGAYRSACAGGERVCGGMVGPRGGRLSQKEDRGDRVPDFTIGQCGDGFEAGFAYLPPLFDDFVGCHFCHIGIDVGASVFEVAEDQVFTTGHLLVENRVVLDMAIRDRL